MGIISRYKMKHLYRSVYSHAVLSPLFRFVLICGIAVHIVYFLFFQLRLAAPFTDSTARPYVVYNSVTGDDASVETQEPYRFIRCGTFVYTDIPECDLYS